MEYVKQITGRLKDGKREEGLKIIAELWNDNVGNVKGLTAFVLMANLQYSHGVTNTTIWETKEGMDEYYSGDKKYRSVLEKIKPMMEDEIERREFTIFKKNQRH
jgi:hypothetical protein